MAPESELQPDMAHDTPHFLNPEVLQETESAVNYDAEETVSEDTEMEHIEQAGAAPAGAHPILSQPPEKVEAVLNAGMQFIGGLLEMATGQPIATAGGAVPMVQVDRERGEITLKFKLPGF
jgi:hypothetical protein